jgi:hypothetical protein
LNLLALHMQASSWQRGHFWICENHTCPLSLHKCSTTLSRVARTTKMLPTEAIGRTTCMQNWPRKVVVVFGARLDERLAGKWVGGEGEAIWKQAHENYWRRSGRWRWEGRYALRGMNGLGRCGTPLERGAASFQRAQHVPCGGRDGLEALNMLLGRVGRKRLWGTRLGVIFRPTCPIGLWDVVRGT